MVSLKTDEFVYGNRVVYHASLFLCVLIIFVMLSDYYLMYLLVKFVSSLSMFFTYSCGLVLFCLM